MEGEEGRGPFKRPLWVMPKHKLLFVFQFLCFVHRLALIHRSGSQCPGLFT